MAKPKSKDLETPLAPNASTEITRADIAKAAKVSPGLVSAFFSGKHYTAESRKGIGISQATRKKIKDTCLKLNYIPKDPALFARIYPEQADVGFLLNKLIPDGYANPYFSLVLDGVVQRANAESVSLQTFLFDPHHDYVIDSSPLPGPILNGAIKKVLLGGGDPNYSLLITLNRLGVSVVQLSQTITFPGAMAVVPDHYNGTREALRRIHGAGHRNIAIVAERYHDRTHFRGNVVRQACVDEMRALGLPFQESDIIVKAREGHEEKSSVLPQLEARKPFPTAIYCITDWTAQILMPVLMEAGYRIPDDVSIVGMDDDRISQVIKPGLTTMHVPHRRLGARAFDEVQKMAVNGQPTDPTSIILPVEWVERESLKRI